MIKEYTILKEKHEKKRTAHEEHVRNNAITNHKTQSLQT